MMESGSILIAETDPSVLHGMPRLLTGHFPSIQIEVATSVQETAHKFSHSRFSTIIAAPYLIRTEPFLLHRLQKHQLLSPVIITATETDLIMARDLLLTREAFDVIAKPVDEVEALSSIRLALWQARFCNSWRSENACLPISTVISRPIRMNWQFALTVSIYQPYMNQGGWPLKGNSKERSLERIL